MVAYKQVGDLLVRSSNQGKLQRRPLDVTAVPKSPVTNSDKVKAAAPTRSSNKNKVEKFINPLSMSDDDFFKTI
ncbi:MAG: hypothetical protein ACLU5J_12920 [Christensenellales bacterium]